MRSIRVILLLLLAFTSGCIYDPKGEYVDPILPPDTSNSAINLLATQDPVVLSSPTAFVFTIVPSGKPRYAVQVKYDNAIVFERNSWPGPTVPFILSPAGHPANGKLTITVGYQSQSQSIAGQLGAEIIVLTRTWDVVVDMTPPQPIGAPTITIEDGKSIIRWPEPSKYNIKEMMLIRVDHADHLDTLRIPSIYDTEFHDFTYVGGDVTYRVDMKSGSYVKGATTSFTCVPIEPVMDIKTGIVSWAKPLLYGNTLDLFVNDVTKPLTEAGSFDPGVLFGETLGVNIRLRPKSILVQGNPFTRSLIASRGIKLPVEDGPVRFHAAANAYFMIDDKGVVKIDPVTFQQTARLVVTDDFLQNMAFSQNGQFNYITDRYNLYRFDPVAFTVTEKIPLSSLVGGFQRTIWYPPGVSDDNIMNLTTDNVHYIFDMNTKTLLWQKNLVDMTFLSPDGNFLTERAVVYKRNGNTWEEFGHAEAEEQIYLLWVFIQEEGHNLVVGHGSESFPMYFFDLDAPPGAGGVIQRLNLIQNKGQYNYDHFTNTLFTQANDRAMLYNTSDWQVRKTIEGVSDQSNVFLLNNVLFNDRGYYLPNN